jgi:hypothetical protein
VDHEAVGNSLFQRFQNAGIDTSDDRTAHIASESHQIALLVCRMEPAQSTQRRSGAQEESVEPRRT